MNEIKVEKKWYFWLFSQGWKIWEILVGSTSFLSFPSKTQYLQIGEKMGMKSGQKYLDKIAHIFFLLFFFGYLNLTVNVACLPFFFLFFFWGLNGFFFFFFIKKMMMCKSVIHHSTIHALFFFWDGFYF